MGVLKQVKMGVPVVEPIRQVGISEQRLYRWKKEYREGIGPGSSDQAAAVIQPPKTVPF